MDYACQALRLPVAVLLVNLFLSSATRSSPATTSDSSSNVRIAVSILVGAALFFSGLITSAMALTANQWAFADEVISNTGMVGPAYRPHVGDGVPPAEVAMGSVHRRSSARRVGRCVPLAHRSLISSSAHPAGHHRLALGSVLVVAATVRMCLAPAVLNPFALFFLPDPAQDDDLDDRCPAGNLAITSMTIVAAVIGLGISLGVGVLLRRTRRIETVDDVAAERTQRIESLTAELARQSERELLGQGAA